MGGIDYKSERKINYVVVLNLYEFLAFLAVYKQSKANKVTIVC